jgi:hypothetical protein
LPRFLESDKGTPIMISKVSSGGVSRDVTFNLRVNGDGLKQLLRDVKDAEMKFRDLGPKANATRQQTEAYQKMGKAIKDAASEVDKLAKAEVKKREAIEAELKKQIAAVDKAYAARRTAEEKAAARDEAAFAKSLAKKNAEEQKATAAAIREQEKVTKALERESAKRAAIQQRETQSFIAAKQREAAAAQSLSGRGPFGSNEAMFRTGRGILDVGRGLALSGLVGEQDASKLLDTLLKIEATYSGVKGGIEAYQGLSGAVQNYVEALKAAKQAEEALRMVRAVKAGVPLSAIGSGGTALAGTGAAGAAGGEAAGGAAALAGSGVASAAIIVTGLVMSLITLKEHLDGTAQAAEGMTGALMRLFAPITDLGASLLNSFGFLGGDRTAAMEGEAASIRAKKDTRDLWNDVADIQQKGDAQIRGVRWAQMVGGIMDDYHQASFGADPSSQMVNIRTAQLRNLQARDQLQAATSFGTSDDRLMAERELKRVNENRIALLKEEYSLVEQTAAKALEGSREQLKALEDQKKLQQQIAKEAEERYMTGKERFGNMNQSEQQRLIQTQQAFKYAQSLDQKGDPASRARAERIRASVPVEDRQKLASLGLTEGVEYNRQAAYENAARNGYNAVFGYQEIQATQQAQQAEANLNVQIANQNQVVVNINATLEAQKQALKAELQKEFAIQQAAANAEIERKVKELWDRMEKDKADRISQNKQKEVGKNNQFPG